MSDSLSVPPEDSGAPRPPRRSTSSEDGGTPAPERVGRAPELGSIDPAATEPAHRRRRGSRGGRSRNRPSSVRAVVDGDAPVAAGSARPRPDFAVPPRPDFPAPPAPDFPAPPPPDFPVALPLGSDRPFPALPDRPVAPDTVALDTVAPDTVAPLPPLTAVAPESAAPTDSRPEPPEGPPPTSGEAPSRPKIGDSRPAPPALIPVRGPGGGSRPSPGRHAAGGSAAGEGGLPSERSGGGSRTAGGTDTGTGTGTGTAEGRRRRRGSARGKAAEHQPVQAVLVDTPAQVDEDTLDKRRGRERKGRPVGRYQMVVHVQPGATQIAVLEGRSLIEHYVSRPADDAAQIDGNIYIGRVQNVLPGMEAAFVDISTPKNAVLYRGDVRYDKDDLDGSDSGGKSTRGKVPAPARSARIEQLLKPGQTVLCQVTKNPIGAKGARLSQEVSLPGRFVVLIPNSDTYGISKRLADDERKRLRAILDDIRPEGHGLIVRTAAEGANADELRRDVARLVGQWNRIDAMATTARAPRLLYREPDMAVRVIREEFNRDYRGILIDDRVLYEEIRDYVASISPELADRVEFAGDSDDPLPVFERLHVHEQIHKALDRKVWLPSGGSLIIERTEALTVIDVNTGKNVGTSNLEETVFRNNLEAAEEIARQLRLRDIGGIIVIDFIDMEVMANRTGVMKTFREALARDKTRTQVFEISELGLVEMTRKRISEGLVESFSQTCPTCAGRGFVLDDSLL
jgi:ribonuclease E